MTHEEALPTIPAERAGQAREVLLTLRASKRRDDQDVLAMLRAGMARAAQWDGHLARNAHKETLINRTGKFLFRRNVAASLQRVRLRGETLGVFLPHTGPDVIASYLGQACGLFLVVEGAPCSP